MGTKIQASFMCRNNILETDDDSPVLEIVG